MRLKFKIFCTNWINIAGIYLAVYFFSLFDVIANPSNSIGDIFIIALFGLLPEIAIYGWAYWLVFISVIFLLDMALFSRNTKFFNSKIIMEWAATSSPFFYLLVKHRHWVLLIGICAFFVAQCIRSKKILEIIAENS